MLHPRILLCRRNRAAGEQYRPIYTAAAVESVFLIKKASGLHALGQADQRGWVSHGGVKQQAPLPRSHAELALKQFILQKALEPLSGPGVEVQVACTLRIPGEKPDQLVGTAGLGTGLAAQNAVGVQTATETDVKAAVWI